MCLALLHKVWDKVECSIRHLPPDGRITYYIPAVRWGDLEEGQEEALILTLKHCIPFSIFVYFNDVNITLVFRRAYLAHLHYHVNDSICYERVFR